MKKLTTLLLSCLICAAMLVPVVADDTLQLSPPWVEYAEQLRVLFEEDPEIAYEYDDDTHEITLMVEDTKKAEAIDALLPDEKTFGNVSVKVTVIPANDGAEPTRSELIKDAFEGNPIYKYTTTVDGIMSNPISFVVFKNEVVQYWNDNLGDLYGLTSTLYQEIAKEVIGGEGGIYYCTEPKEPTE